MKKSTFNPNRKEVEEAVEMYLKNGGKIDDQRIQAKRSIQKEIESTWANDNRTKSEPWGGLDKPKNL